MVSGYALFYKPLEDSIAELHRVTQLETADVLKLQTWQSAIKRSLKNNKKKELAISSMLAFLSKMNVLFAKHNLVVKNVNPGNDHDLKMSFNLKTDYFKFIHFLADLELLNIVLERVDIYPFHNNKNPPYLSIKMAIGAPTNAPMANPIRLAALKKQLSTSSGRDPFTKKQKRQLRSASNRVTTNKELTWKYLLSGIGQLANGEYFANINRRVYRVGDILEDKKIREILNDRVNLIKQANTGTESYTLRFRKQLKKRASSN